MKALPKPRLPIGAHVKTVGKEICEELSLPVNMKGIITCDRMGYCYDVQIGNRSFGATREALRYV